MQNPAMIRNESLFASTYIKVLKVVLNNVFVAMVRLLKVNGL